MIEKPEWRVAHIDNGTIAAYIVPLHKRDHQWFNVDLFYLRPAWRDPQYSNDEWMVKWHHTKAEYVYFKTFKTRREALRKFGEICRDYWAMAVARYEEMSEIAQFMGEDR